METIELEVLSGYCCVYAVDGPKLTFVFFCLVLHYHYIYKAVIEKHTNVFAYPLVSFLLWCVQTENIQTGEIFCLVCMFQISIVNDAIQNIFHATRQSFRKVKFTKLLCIPLRTLEPCDFRISEQPVQYN